MSVQQRAPAAADGPVVGKRASLFEHWQRVQDGEFSVMSERLILETPEVYRLAAE